MPLFVDAIRAFKNTGASRRGSSDGWYYPGMSREGSISLTDGLTASYSAIYRGQPWVYAAMNKLARSVARTPLKVYQGPSDDREYVTEGELYDRLARPSDSYGMARWTPFRFKERIVKSVGIYGYSMSIKMGMQNESSVPESILSAPSIGWTWAKNGDYIWTSRSGDEFVFKHWQVIRIDFWDLDDYGFGMSMLEPLRMALAVEDAAQRFAVSAFKNGARPSSVLKTDTKLAPDSATKLQALQQHIHGGPDKAFRIAVLENGLDWAPWPNHDLEEAALINHRKLTREEVATVFDVPQSSIGILDESNFASVDAFHTALYQDSLGPWIKLIEENLQAQLVDATPAFSEAGYKVEFDMHGLMRGADSTQYRNYATALSAGFMTRNEVRARENLPPSDQPEADLLMFPLNQSGAPGAELAEDTGQLDDEDETAEAVATYQQNGAAAHA